MTRVLFVIDMVRGFTEQRTKDGPCVFYMPNARNTLFNINREINSLQFGDRLYYVVDSHTPDAEEYKFLPIHCAKGSEEALLDADLILRGDVTQHILEKNHMNMFISTNIPETFIDKRDEEGFFIEVCGVATELCVDAAVRGFAERGFKVVVHKDCIAGLDETLSNATIEIWKKFYGVQIL